MAFPALATYHKGLQACGNIITSNVRDKNNKSEILYPPKQLNSALQQVKQICTNAVQQSKQM